MFHSRVESEELRGDDDPHNSRGLGFRIRYLGAIEIRKTCASLENWKLVPLRRYAVLVGRVIVGAIDPNDLETMSAKPVPHDTEMIDPCANLFRIFGMLCQECR
jgi:hypothetical protein